MRSAGEWNIWIKHTLPSMKVDETLMKGNMPIFHHKLSSYKENNSSVTDTTTTSISIMNTVMNVSFISTIQRTRTIKLENGIIT